MGLLCGCCLVFLVLCGLPFLVWFGVIVYVWIVIPSGRCGVWYFCSLCGSAFLDVIWLVSWFVGLVLGLVVGLLVVLFSCEVGIIQVLMFIWLVLYCGFSCGIRCKRCLRDFWMCC